MARRNISLPDALDQVARREGLNVSALTQAAIVQELDRRNRMAQLGHWLDELDEEHGAPTAGEVAEAEAWLLSGEPVVPRTPSIAIPGQAADAKAKGPRRRHVS